MTSSPRSWPMGSCLGTAPSRITSVVSTPPSLVHRVNARPRDDVRIPPWCEAGPEHNTRVVSALIYSFLTLSDPIGGLTLSTTPGARPNQTRRTVVKGAAWSVPIMAVGAPAAHAGVSQCEVEGSIQVGPMEFVDVRAVCRGQSQTINPTTIYANYGRAYLPTYLEICNCENTDQWYRWQETDDRSSFQIEVDGVHNDQNGPGQGWRPSFQLPKYGDVGGCKRFNLTYRTSASRPYSSNQSSVPGNAQSVDIDFVLEKGPSATGPWTPVTSINVTGGATWRTVGSGGWWGDPVDFGDCDSQGPFTARQAEPEASDDEPKPTTEGERTHKTPPAPEGNGD